MFGYCRSSLLEKTQAVRLRQISELRTIIVDGLEHQKLVRDKMRDAMELAKDNLRRYITLTDRIIIITNY
jgi:hypothetical protein